MKTEGLSTELSLSKSAKPSKDQIRYLTVFHQLENSFKGNELDQIIIYYFSTESIMTATAASEHPRIGSKHVTSLKWIIRQVDRKVFYKISSV